MKQHRILFGILLIVYISLGVTTAIILKPIVTKTRAYDEIHPILAKSLDDLTIGELSAAPRSEEQTAPLETTNKDTAFDQSEPASDAAAETASEADAAEQKEESESLPEGERKYYTFVTANVQQILYVRSEPGLNKKAIARLKPGTKGIVLQEGTNWCYIMAGDIIGFSSTEYLKLTEVPKEKFPPDYLDIKSPFSLDVPNR